VQQRLAFLERLTRLSPACGKLNLHRQISPPAERKDWEKHLLGGSEKRAQEAEKRPVCERAPSAVALSLRQRQKDYRVRFSARARALVGLETTPFSAELRAPGEGNLRCPCGFSFTFNETDHANSPFLSSGLALGTEHSVPHQKSLRRTAPTDRWSPLGKTGTVPHRLPNRRDRFRGPESRTIHWPSTLNARRATINLNSRTRL